MKTKRHHRLLTALTLALFAISRLDAQTLTETLQKAIWNPGSPMTADGWAAHLPDGNSDTLLHADAATAETFLIDASGRPTEVILLLREAGAWTPRTRTVAHWDSLGCMTSLQSWIYDHGNWINESLTNKHRDANGNALRVNFMTWEDGGWTTSFIHQYSQPAPMLGAR